MAINEKELPRPRILAVDDDHAVLRSLTQILGEKFDIFTATEESTGLELARACRPDLILLDISLGTGSGVNLCYSLRNSPDTRDIPVMILSGHEDSTIRELAFDAGADDYLDKQSHPAELLSRVESKLRRWHELRGLAG